MKLSFVVGCFLLASCASLSPPPTPSDTDPVLHELTKLSQEIKRMRSEMGELRQAVTEIHRASVAPPTAAAPPPQVVKQVSLDDDPILGSREATIGIIEFTDFECPFCRRYHQQTFDKIEENYIDTGKIRYVVRDFPLEFHGEAKGAAIAANCAGEQDAYWLFYHELFSNQRRLGPELFEELATTLHLDIEAFQACLKDPDQAKEVNNDSDYGKSIGVRGTPHFFVGRIEDGQLIAAKRISGAQPYSVFSQAVEALLE